jgi:hypothetical protein
VSAGVALVIALLATAVAGCVAPARPLVCYDVRAGRCQEVSADGRWRFIPSAQCGDAVLLCVTKGGGD